MADSPTPTPRGTLYPVTKEEGYWLGGAMNELEHWRKRALTAEARVRELEVAQARMARR